MCYPLEIIYMRRKELEEIIFEELQAALRELDEATFIMEKKPRDPRARPGQKFKPDSKTQVYTSRGTVPNNRGRKMTGPEIAKRKEIGKKIINTLRRGTEGGSAKNNSPGTKLKRALQRHAKKHGWNPNDLKTIYSFAWAMATDYALTGREFGGRKNKKATDTSSKKKTKITRPAAKNKKFGTFHNPHQERLSKGKPQYLHSK